MPRQTNPPLGENNDRCIYFTEIPVFNTKSVDSNQTSHSAVYKLALHCLSMSHLWGAKHKWVILYSFSNQKVLVFLSSARQTIQMKCQTFLSRKKNWMLSAAILNGAETGYTRYIFCHF